MQPYDLYGSIHQRELPPILPAYATESLITAYERYCQRWLGREQPDGKRDHGGRWHPNAAERQPCCERIRQPSRQWPGSLLAHCTSARHVAALCGASERDLRRLLAWVAWYWQPARTSHHGTPFCPQCGCSWWPCDCQPEREWRPSDPNLVAVPDHRADMTIHLGS